MTRIDELKRGLAEEGFVHIYEWEDGSNTVYPAHAHQGKVSMYILKGGLTIAFKSGDVSLNPGDGFDVPIGEEHTAKVGPEGCSYLVGEMIEGDS